jgi:hypothetical protein
LKAVAYAKHWQTLLCHSFYLLHYWAMGSNYPGAKPVAKGEASGEYHCVIPRDVFLGVPNKVRLDSYYIAKNMVNVAVAVAARENSYPNSRCHYFAIKTCKSFY